MSNSIILPPNASNDFDLELDDFAQPNANPKDKFPARWINGDPTNNNGDWVFKNLLLDTLINAEVLLLYNDEMKSATIKEKSTDINGDQVGTYNE